MRLEAKYTTRRIEFCQVVHRYLGCRPALSKQQEMPQIGHKPGPIYCTQYWPRILPLSNVRVHVSRTRIASSQASASPKSFVGRDLS